MKFETRAIHLGQEPDPQTGAVIPPIDPGLPRRGALRDGLREWDGGDYGGVVDILFG